MPEIAASIELTIYADGTIKVSKESGAEETEEHEATGIEMGGTKAKDLDDALKIARGMAQEALGMPPSAAPEKPAMQARQPMRGIPTPAPTTTSIGNWK